MELPNELTLNQFKQNYENNVLIYYTVHLAMGHIFLFRSIRVDTIIKYLNAVVVFSIPQGLQNPTHDQYYKCA